jgi:NAD(P)-dependent dehydrogenase (short-subunit alcohol dehydrogenase family)
MNRIVVITGASAGIGAALARQLGQAGDRIVLAARREPELRAVAADISDSLVVPADVTVRNDVERVRDEAISKFGHVDVWVNNAGRGISKPVLELTDADLDQMVLINVKSALYGMQAIVPHFVQRGGGHVVNVSSFLSKVPVAPIGLQRGEGHAQLADGERPDGAGQISGYPRDARPARPCRDRVCEERCRRHAGLAAAQQRHAPAKRRGSGGCDSARH